ncbi:MAG: TIGR04282 family arsenosugar biosynthesis glycosyltransferase [Gammaproteobacteria bacterium]|nr:TIGR04282 family arsenosugar biosynthesis glycosyltransferase [Gammaproteobacteria bacterium]
MQSAPTRSALSNTIIEQTALLVFTKTPIPGAVKTRLLSVMDAQQAAAIHTELLRFTLEVARRSAASAVELWCTPTRQHPLLQDLARRFAVTLQTQSGADLGARICAAMTQTLASYRHVLLVGSDCIDLSPEDINLALEQLAAGSDVALGPAFDGGYYLIGLSRPQRRLFEGINWGTDRVLQQTRKRVAQLGLSLFELPQRRDLDRPEDLRYFRPDAPAEGGRL